jgi:hypothetical protein
MNELQTPPTLVGWPVGGGNIAVSCPYCYCYHTHGGTGHRQTHCGGRVPWEEKAPGYYIVLGGASAQNQGKG